MKAISLRELSSADLQNKNMENLEELLRLRFQAATGVLENPLRIRLLKKENARIKTILAERKEG